MKPIPEAAMSVVEILRRDTKSPEFLPNAREGHLRWDSRNGRRCPMSLHPNCGVHDYYCKFAQFGVPYESQSAFTDWWDSLAESDAAEAMDAIWPRTVAAG